MIIKNTNIFPCVRCIKTVTLQFSATNEHMKFAIEKLVRHENFLDN